MKNTRSLIDQFKDEYFFLSNFYKCEIMFDGITYKSTEAAFQAQKTLDLAERMMIADMNPSEAKRYCGRRGSVTLRPSWDTIKDDLMYNIVKAKFNQNNDLRWKLIYTRNAILVEGNSWHDNYWGNCSCSKCNKFLGQNKLGQILMRVREELIHEIEG